MHFDDAELPVVGESLTIGIDIGGTFTDVAMVSAAGQVHMNKAPTTPADPSRGVFDALERAATQLGTDLAGLLARAERITHGSTIATNALLTRTGAKVGADHDARLRGYAVHHAGHRARRRHRRGRGPAGGVAHQAGAAVSHGRIRGVRERVDALGPVPKPALRPSALDGAATPEPKGRRSVHMGDGFEPTPVYEWARLQPGQQVAGPAVVESEFTTVLVPPRARARMDAYGNLVLEL
jgi:N-methylhydantoinase A/oxoprolinase/acetone carboxylase beta subunit